MQVRFRVFRSSWERWEALLEQAAAFATQIGQQRLISISHSEDNQDGVIVVWYWEA